LKDGYSFCHHHLYNLSLIDFSLFAQLPYLPPNSLQLSQYLSTLYPEFSIRKDRAYERVSFYDLYSSRHNLSVITIRGTNAFDLLDFVVDLDIWFEGLCLCLFLCLCLCLFPPSCFCSHSPLHPFVFPLLISSPSLSSFQS
jgi:hypothetical protein